MSLYDAREHVRTIWRCPSRHDPEPTDTPVSPPPHLSVFTHFGIWLPPGGNHIPKWRNSVGLGGEVAVDVGEDVCFAVDVEADVALGVDGSDDAVGDDLSGDEVEVG